MRKVITGGGKDGCNKDAIGNIFWPTILFYICRINAMTFRSFGRSITIKNEKIARVLIAQKNTWGIETSVDKRKRLSVLGVISYILLLPEIVFVIYDWWIFVSTKIAGQARVEKLYITITVWFYLVAISINIVEAEKFEKGKIW